VVWRLKLGSEKLDVGDLRPRDTDVQTLGKALGELCPDDSLMVIGMSHDFAFFSEGESRMFLPPDISAPRWDFRNF